MSDAELTPSSPQLIWDMYLALVQECHHFNALESTYRTLASTWLLAAFAGIGYILTSVHAGTELLISGLSAAGAAGIVLLWVLDMLVYHRLLGAAFSEQLGFEERHSWLPQVAHEMVEMHGGDIVAKVVWFYIVTFSLLIAVFAFTLGDALASTSWRHLVISTTLFIAAGVAPAIAIRKKTLQVTPKAVTSRQRNRRAA